jgi:hypothetical protein
MRRMLKEIILRLLVLAGTFAAFDLADPAISLAITRPSECPDSEEKDPPDAPYKLSSDFPNVQARVHRVGLLNICMTNWGFFGSGKGHSLYDLKESVGGCFSRGHRIPVLGRILDRSRGE